jgi:hypothetical protein
MTARPILMSAPMIRALLDGRKTQTRRELKQPKRKDGAKLLPELLQQIGVGCACPYGQPGDLLWVRETYIPGQFSQLTFEIGVILAFALAHGNDRDEIQHQKEQGL